ncbi:lipid II:glycine glycyltransferase FemX [Patescibacteria group bacterium]
MITDIKDKQVWEDFVSQHPYGHFLQSWEWGLFQNSLDKEIEFLGCKDEGRLIGAALIVYETIRGKYQYAHCPRGPIMDPNLPQEQQKKFICPLINHIENEHDVIFVRVEPEFEVDANPICIEFFDPAPSSLKKGANPQRTRILDLTKSKEDLLKEMKPKTRYNIRLSERKGVKVEQGYDKSLQDNFIKLLKETTERDKFIAYPASYYKKQLEYFGPQGNLVIFQATVNGEPAASIIVSYYGNRAVYLHGASSHKHRAAMPAFAVQWAAIQAAQEKQMKTYDFWGIAPEDAKPDHPWAGISRFKEGFGGYVKNWIGPHDHVIKPLLYKAYTGYRKMRR